MISLISYNETLPQFVVWIDMLLYTPVDVGLYNRLTVFHEFHVFDKASKDKVMTGSTSDVIFCFSYQPKGSDAGTRYY